MSRRLPSSHRRIPSQSENPYQGTTYTLPANKYIHQPQYVDKEYSQRASQNPYRNSYVNATTNDTGLSDDAYTDTTYYEYYHDQRYQNDLPVDSRHTNYTYSEGSGSTRLPLYETEDDASIARNAYLDRINRLSHIYKDKRSQHNKDLRRVYPNQDEGSWDRLYQEIPSPCDIPPVPTHISSLQASRLSDRPQSSSSSTVTSGVIDGCGGKCKTFENVCYFFLQLVFTMGILIGVSLCIAGMVLRKSAARNLQLLVYIGGLVAVVSSVLLQIQCNARRTAKNRRKSMWRSKRAPIPLETLNLRNGNGIQQQQHLMQQSDNKTFQLPQTHHTLNIQCPPPPQTRAVVETSLDHQGIPWWRRKDLNT